MEIPNTFWKYYDLFRRKQLTITQFSEKAEMAEEEIKRILEELLKNA